MKLRGIRSCWDLSGDHLKEALTSRDAMGALLRELADAARPGQGAAKILIAIARMGRPSCDWIEGSLRVEVEGDAETTRIAIMQDLGGGVRELVFPRLVLQVPLEELARGLRLAPRAVEPLIVQDRVTKFVLARKKASDSHKPPSFALAEDCLRRSMPPAECASLPPPASRSSARTTARAGEAELLFPKIPRLAELEDALGDPPAPKSPSPAKPPSKRPAPPRPSKRPPRPR